MAKNVLIIATDGFEQSELEEPRRKLEDAGFETVLASIEEGEILGWAGEDWGDTVEVDLTLDQVEVDNYDALLLPGGQINPDKLRLEKDVIEILRGFAESQKPIAAICHAPWLLVEAGLARGRTLTGWPSIRTDLTNAGANVVDEEVVVDGNLITSRNPDDVPAFSDTLIRVLEREKIPEDA